MPHLKNLTLGGLYHDDFYSTSLTIAYSAKVWIRSYIFRTIFALLKVYPFLSWQKQLYDFTLVIVKMKQVGKVKMFMDVDTQSKLSVLIQKQTEDFKIAGE